MTPNDTRGVVLAPTSHLQPGSYWLPLAAVRAAAAGRADGGERIIHDALDGPRAAPALGAAAEAAIDVDGRTRARPRGFDRASHVVIRQYIAGTDDHGTQHPSILVRLLSHKVVLTSMQSKSADYRDSNVHASVRDVDSKAASPVYKV
jgi:hypothetical protein